MQASSSVFRRLHKRSASHPEELGAAQRAGSGPLTAPSAKGGQDRAVVKRKKLLFVHFRINRVHCRVTYKVGSHLFNLSLDEHKLWLHCHAVLCCAGKSPDWPEGRPVPLQCSKCLLLHMIESQFSVTQNHLFAVVMLPTLIRKAACCDHVAVLHQSQTYRIF